MEREHHAPARPEDALAGHPAPRPAAQADVVARCLAFEPRARVLDLACGPGRQTIELARRGFRVLGVDQHEESLARARAAAGLEKLNIHFLKADSRRIPYRDEFDAVVGLFSPLGGLTDDRDMLRLLDGARKALKPGGKLVLDLLNREWLLRHFERLAGSAGAVRFDLETGVLEHRRGTTVSRWRLFTLTELRALLERCGLAFVGAWGGCEEQDYGIDSPRLLMLASRSLAEVGRRRRPVDELESALRVKGRKKGR